MDNRIRHLLGNQGDLTPHPAFPEQTFLLFSLDGPTPFQLAPDAMGYLKNKFERKGCIIDEISYLYTDDGWMICINVRTPIMSWFGWYSSVYHVTVYGRSQPSLSVNGAPTGDGSGFRYFISGWWKQQWGYMLLRNLLHDL
jgi:hypothetical protein